MYLLLFSASLNSSGIFCTLGYDSAFVVKRKEKALNLFFKQIKCYKKICQRAFLYDLFNAKIN